MMQQLAASDRLAIGTPFGRSLGIDASTLVFNLKRTECSLTVTPSREQVNHRGTVHGGYVQAVFDEVAAVLVAKAFGPGAAVTSQASVQFRQSARPNQPIRFEVKIVRRSPERLWINGQASCGPRKVATLESSWLRRPVRARP